MEQVVHNGPFCKKCDKPYVEGSSISAGQVLKAYSVHQCNAFDLREKARGLRTQADALENEADDAMLRGIGRF